MRQSNTGQYEKIVVVVDQDMEDIIPEFLSNARDDVQALLEALGRGDYETVRVLGHSIKGVGGFGFDQLSQLGLSLEQAAKRKNVEEMRNLAEQLSYYLQHVEVDFE